MSHLRAPATRADRREGGRHGRPVARPAPASAETHIRPQLLRLAVLPPTAVALSACAVVLFTVRSTGVRPGVTLWAVLAGAVAVTGVGIVIAAVAADRAARSVSDRVAALRRGSARGEADLRAVIEALRRGEVPPRRTSRGGPPGDADDFELLAADLARAHDGAVTAVVQAAQLSSQAGSEQKLEVFVNLARRLQSLVHREISILDELENAIEDPDLLKGLFHVDHLATRIRRHAENLAVLGGAVSRRQWSNPVPMTEVLRSAIAEVEQYARVKLVPPIDGELRGHAVADVIHLLAELVENATVFSAPHTQVLLRANLVTSGLAVEVEDRGLGMPVEEQSRMNALLADPDQVNVGRLLADGRIGLFVVSQLARRHGIRVRLQNNIYGGVQAVLVVPQALLGSAPGVPGAVPREPDTDGGGLPLVPAAPPAPADPVRPPLPPAPQPRAARNPDPAQPHDPRHTPDVGRPTGFAHPQDVPGAGGPSVPSPGRDTDGAGRSFGPARAQGGATAPGLSAGSPQAWDGSGTGGPSVSSPGRDTDGAGRSFGPARVQGGVAASGSPEAWDMAGAGRTPAPVPAPTQDTPGSGVPLVASPPQGHPGGSGPARVAAPPPHLGPAVAEPIPQRPGAPAPLPVRGARAARPNPAEAVPGIRRGDRPVVEEHAGIAPTPRVGTVRGTMGKPQLPRRRAQEHIVPQLRGGPAPRQDSEQPVGHDPNLMAAFQRGIGLAEAQQSLEANVLDPAPFRPPAPLEVLLDPAAHPAPDHDRRPGGGEGAEEGGPVPLPADADVRPPHPSRIPQARPTPAAAPPEAYGARDGLDLPGPDRSTARHDGSAPAG
ncbi:ATP-binding protein [Streptomyces asoensis]|uniref:histidine kinase n=1 Tax=Streptomyces asoensis TaxID=249586 RepID=A0A6M4X0U3_9ACTN|nr:ATP-binding protein [Streptomyces asoensis]QJT05411.1 ATP-binding protein [Streptomyces asoensis]